MPFAMTPPWMAGCQTHGGLTGAGRGQVCPDPAVVAIGEAGALRSSRLIRYVSEKLH